MKKTLKIKNELTRIIDGKEFEMPPNNLSYMIGLLHGVALAESTLDTALKSIKEYEWRIEEESQESDATISNMETIERKIMKIDTKKINALRLDLSIFDELFCEDSYSNDYTLDKEDLELIIAGLELLEKETECK